MQPSDDRPTDANDSPRQKQELQAIQEALRGLRFGSVNVIVQDGIVVQIDRTEKKRLGKPQDSR